MNSGLNDREMNAVLAGLRLLQRGMPMDEGILSITTNDGEATAISDVEIDELCERLNTHHDADLGRRCTNCNSPRVQIQCWIDANKLIPIQTSSDDVYCPACDEHDKRFAVLD